MFKFFRVDKLFKIHYSSVIHFCRVFNKTLPGWFYPYKIMGLLYLRQQNSVMAFKTFNDALVNVKLSSKDLINLGLIYAGMGEYSGALGFFNNCQLESVDLKVKENIAYCYYMVGNLFEAVKILKDVLNSDPKRFWVLKMLGNIYRDLCEYKLALGYYLKAILIDPDDPLVYYDIAVIYGRMDQFDVALDYLERVLKFYPASFEVLEKLAYCYYRLNQYNRAKKCLLEALLINSESVYALSLLGIVYYDLCDPVKSVKYLEKAAKLSPSDVNVHYNLGISTLQLGNYRKGRASLLQAAFIDRSIKSNVNNIMMLLN